VAEDVTVEADSGGHTDNRPLTALFPVIAQLRDDSCAEHGYTRPIRVGAAGGLGTPGRGRRGGVRARRGLCAHRLGQPGRVESGLSERRQALLAQAAIADVIMAPAADMFELGVKVQVLKRGTMFGVRAQQALRALHARTPRSNRHPRRRARALERRSCCSQLARGVGGHPRLLQKRDPREVARAERDPSTRWRWCSAGTSACPASGPSTAIRAPHGLPDLVRPRDGRLQRPGCAGSFLERRSAARSSRSPCNLLEGAAVVTRAQQLRSYGVPVPAAAIPVLHPTSLVREDP
jgi:trans-AT polyketide synthase/acyltransferase/oxidoreductase domain-containing protein